MSGAAVRVCPITPADVPAVAEFLHRHLNQRLAPAAWAQAVSVPWKVDAPNAGFLLRADDRVVGACLAFYSDRAVGDRTDRFCNLGAWCVHPDYRFHALRLLKAVLAQEGYHFTDLSPSGSVPAINERLGFQHLDTTTAVVPNLPWPGWPGRGTVSADPQVIDATLRGPVRDLYRDHVGTAAARHLVLVRGQRWCYVMFRRDRRKRLPLFASILYVSHPEVFREMIGPLTRHLLMRHRIVATLLELRVTGHRPRWSRLLRRPRAKMFRSAAGRVLDPGHVDNLYSELACVAW